MAEKKLKKTKKVSEKSEIIKENKRAVEDQMEKTLQHVMVPKHEVLSEKEAEELLGRFNITRAQLPSILLGDPAIKGFDVKGGDIIKVTRENPVTGTSYAYRVVTAV
jgi:DNA-directed RNA polymerase subunit H